MENNNRVETDAQELKRLMRDEPHLVSIPVKNRRDPYGMMLLLPVSSHLVVVPTALVRSDDIDAGLDEIWSCLVVQSENTWETALHSTVEISRSTLRRSTVMMAVVAPSRG